MGDTGRGRGERKGHAVAPPSRVHFGLNKGPIESQDLFQAACASPGIVSGMGGKTEAQMSWEPGWQCLQPGTKPPWSPIPFSPTGPGLGVGQS